LSEDIRSLSPGDRLQSTLTGYTYTVSEVDEDEGEIQMEGQPPVPLEALQEDLDKDRLKTLSADENPDSIP